MMAGVRQMPQSYLRGSLANITMLNLTEEEKQKAQEYFEIVRNHPEMGKHKSKLIQQFGITISGDYKDDPQTAEAEFDIAIWKGIIDLFFHSKYSFKCEACESSTYITKKNKIKTIDRALTPCPNCNKCKISESNIDGHEPGNYIDYAAFLEYIEHDGSMMKVKTTVQPIPLGKKHPNPGIIFEDPDQMRKLMGEYVWNYFRQHISENTRTKSETETTIIERADIVTALKIINICQKFKIKVQTSEDYSNIVIIFKTHLTTPEFTVELANVLYKARINNVLVTINSDGIIISKNELAGQLTEKVIVSDLIKLQGNSEEEQEHFGKISKGGHFVDSENTALQVDLEEALNEVRESLPNGVCRSIFNIKTQYGDDYQKFTDTFPNVDNPHNSQIASHLKIGTRVIHQHMNTIRVVCMAKGLKP